MNLYRSYQSTRLKLLGNKIFNIIKMRIFSLWALPLLFLFGCASLEPTLPTSSTIEPGSGIISAQSYTSTSKGFALVVQNTATSKRYGLTLGSDAQPAATFADKVTAIKVPTGQYKLVSWSSDGLMVHSVEGSGAQRNPLLQPFTVTDGSVIVMGRFILDTRVNARLFSTEVQTGIRSGRVSLKEVQDTFRSRYPLVKESEFRCLACFE